MVKTYTLNIPAKLSISAPARDIAVSIFDQIGFAQQEIPRLKLIFDEVYMNSVKYGSTEDSLVSITFTFENNILTVQFEDEGGEKKISASDLRKIIEYQKNNTDLGKKSGRGLAQIVSKWADSLEIRDGIRGGLCVTFTKSLTLPTQPPAPKTEQNIPATDKNNADMLRRKVIPLSGEIDNANSSQKIQPIDDIIANIKSPVMLVLDLKDLKFCNSTFIAQLVTWQQRMQEKGGNMSIENANNNITEIFQLVGLSKVIPLNSSHNALQADQ